MARILLFVSSLGSLLMVTLIYALLAAQSGGSPSASPTPLASAGAGQGAPIGTISVNAFDLGFDPASVDVPQAGVYTVMFHNTGAIAHDLTFADGTKIAAEAGATATGTVTVPAAGITFIC